ncbi:hypothetical protein KY495_21345 [Massilia sp. PAMC28688]|uniref:hypothetical protein n=1 Tax=Massilia sp. PAMC28688 TaxID=2861283 RepID=UPI001C63AD0B|nr:hypothetical protein [Massilia sp. PAMC28688]QYF93200.1 hypothetical protein KY495_21345 [Massilia sp. PAMC28688]
MTRHALFRVLLSLLLLASQHMATAHVLSHWSGSIERSAQAHSGSESAAPGSATALALDQSCHQCLAFAQLGGPLATPYFAFPLPACGSLPVFGAEVAAAHARTILAFHSRGPPHA